MFIGPGKLKWEGEGRNDHGHPRGLGDDRGAHRERHRIGLGLRFCRGQAEGAARGQEEGWLTRGLEAARVGNQGRLGIDAPDLGLDEDELDELRVGR